MKGLIFCSFLLVKLTISAQESSSFVLGKSLYYGNIIAHSKDIAALATAKPFGASFSVAWQNNKQVATESSPIRAKRGFRFAYTHFGNAQQLGEAYQITAFTEPFIGSSRKLFLSFPLDAGASYLTKIYHPIYNPENLFFGSAISFYLGVGAQLNYRFGKQSLANIGVSYQHISNGGIKAPNKGMNYPSLSASYCYYLSQANWQRLNPSSANAGPANHLLRLFLFGSFKTVPNPDLLVPMGGAQILYARSLNTWHHLIFGSELLHNTFKKEWLKRQEIEVNPWEMSVQAGYELRIGKTSLILLMGADALNKNRLNTLLYQRYALVQKLGNRFLLAGTLKANGHVADIFDLRLGYQISQK
jgi:hypothetical protein